MQTAIVASDANPAEKADSKYLNVFERQLAHRFRNLDCGRLSLRFPSGRHMSFDGAADGPNAVVIVKSWSAIFRLMMSGDIGLAEGYMAEEWETPDLAAVFAFCMKNERPLAAMDKPSRGTRILGRLRHACNANSRAGSRRNIAAHYDLGNTFYGHWLDETMTYSAALFSDVDEPMADAQARKYRRLADSLGLKPYHRVLEIGGGWGGFAELAAREYGCRIVCLTVSKEQAAYAQERINRSGLVDQVEIRLEDYRDVDGVFDHIVSIEMFEAVGETFWPTYFDVLRDRLAAGGKAALQVITINDESFTSYRRRPDFIQRYIFPGGMLPSTAAFQASASDAGFETTDTFFFGPSYAETLRRWDRSFEVQWPKIEHLGFDRRFYLMWRYYLQYCAAGFDAGRIDVAHFLLEPR